MGASPGGLRRDNSEWETSESAVTPGEQSADSFGLLGIVQGQPFNQARTSREVSDGWS
jgi:hypothetical protein